MAQSWRKQFAVFIGPAGSGKTSLTGAFGRWIEANQNLRVVYVNLDPGVVHLPYRPDIDARSFVTVDQVMREERLGPNGALIRSVDRLLEHRDSILGEIKRLNADHVLVDTPGQMELFLFRNAGPIFLDALRGLGPVVGVLVFDPTLAYRPEDIVALKLMSMVVRFRLGIDSVVVINKYDLEEARKVIEIIDRDDALKEALKTGKGIIAEIAGSFLEVLDEYGVAGRIVRTSALRGEGLEDLYDILHEVFCTCGDLT